MTSRKRKTEQIETLKHCGCKKLVPIKKYLTGEVNIVFPLNQWVVYVDTLTSTTLTSHKESRNLQASRLDENLQSPPPVWCPVCASWPESHSNCPLPQAVGQCTPPALLPYSVNHGPLLIKSIWQVAGWEWSVPFIGCENLICDWKTERLGITPPGGRGVFSVILYVCFFVI